MLEFKKLELSDSHILKPYFSYCKNIICDNTVCGALMWRDFFHVEYAIYNESIIFKAKVRYHNNVTGFSPPIGGDEKAGIEKIIEYCKYNNITVIFYNVPAYDLEVLHEVFGEFKSCYYEDWSDYLYTASDLTSLSGRRYGGQRNHINFFKSHYPDYTFEVINQNNISDVVDFFISLSTRFDLTNKILSEEYIKTLEAFDNYELYGMLGGVLRVDGKIIAFSLGEIVNHVLFIHIEKAVINIKGAYQVINNEFAKYYCTDDVKFINRAEDNGDIGLRTAKLAYHPCGILNKHIVEIDK